MKTWYERKAYTRSPNRHDIVVKWQVFQLPDDLTSGEYVLLRTELNCPTKEEENLRVMLNTSSRRHNLELIAGEDARREAMKVIDAREQSLMQAYPWE